jgi:3-oxoacyl-[acyl-carrier-protein] synthase I
MIVSGAGMVTAVGNGWEQSGAAIRAGIAGFREVPFVFDGEPLIAAPARSRTANALGTSLLANLAALAVSNAGAIPEMTQCPLLLALPEPIGPDGAPNWEGIAAEMQARLGVEISDHIEAFEAGSISTFMALSRARELLEEVDACVIVAVDSLIQRSRLGDLAARGRLKTASNPDGLIPGEAAVCLVIKPANSQNQGPLVRGLGFSKESVLVGDSNPILGHGLASAMKSALADAKLSMEDVNVRVSDLTGERYGFADANYAMARVLRVRKPILELIHLMDSIGSVGAASGACQLAYLKFGYERDCVPEGAATCETSSDSGGRAVAIVSRS